LVLASPAASVGGFVCPFQPVYFEHAGTTPNAAAGDAIAQRINQAALAHPSETTDLLFFDHILSCYYPRSGTERIARFVANMKIF
jgi:hypothetical protein